jgi:hypothetical protein
MVCETVTRRVPYYETHQEPYTVTRRVARKVARQVPYTVCRMVPRVVERQIPYETCRLVPETICQSGCEDGGCGPGGCQPSAGRNPPSNCSPNRPPHSRRKPIAWVCPRPNRWNSPPCG